MNKNIKISSQEAGERVDIFLSKYFPKYSRNFFIKNIASKNILINNKETKPSYLLKKDDIVLIDIKKEDNIPKPEKIDLKIIFENNDVIVLNKQPGIVVHPAHGNKKNTLVNALLNHFPKIKEAVYDKKNEISLMRPGLVHRLDKDTSGVMIVAKNKKAMRSLSKQIQNKTVSKIYFGLCYDWPKNNSGKLISYLGRHPKNRKLIADIGPKKGREAISNFQVKKLYKYKNHKISLIEFNIETGRTHQIRVQSPKMGNPILGDTSYYHKNSEKLSNELKIKRQLLHSSSLSIKLPGDKKSSLFIADFPDDFNSVLKLLTPQDN